ncbi:11696_t:CDS:2, partial [Ambispora leptoticha]
MTQGSETWLIFTIGILSNFATTMVILWVLAKKSTHEKKTTHAATRLVLNLLIADWFQSISFMMSMFWTAEGEVEIGLYCDIQGIILSFGGLSSGNKMFMTYRDAEKAATDDKAALKLLFYPLVCLLLYSPLAIYLTAVGLFQSGFPYEFYVVAACLFAANGLTDSIVYGCISYVANSRPLIGHQDTTSEKLKGKKRDNKHIEPRKPGDSNSLNSFFEDKNPINIMNSGNDNLNDLFPLGSSSQYPESDNDLATPTVKASFYETMLSNSTLSHESESTSSWKPSVIIHSP